MARLTILATFFVALLIFANASAYRTAITSVTIDEEINPRQSQRCREQIESQQELNRCKQYIRQSRQQGRGMELNSQTLQQCCQQLKQLEQQCQCEGIRQIVRQQQGELRGQQMREAVQTARDLPHICQTGSQRCEIRQVWF